MTEELQFLYRLEPVRLGMLVEPTPEEGEVVGKHFAYLERLTAEGTVFLAGRTLHTDETSFGLVVFRAPDEEAARGIMEADPAVRAGIMRAELFPYRVALSAAPWPAR